MADIKKSQEREELFRTIYKIATDLVHAGHVAEWDFKSYVLGTMFYRYISENFTAYINAGEHAAGNKDFDYAKMSDSDAETAREGLIQEKGFFILPSELFCNVRERADKDENLNETLEQVFAHIESSAASGDAESDFAGLFDDFDVNSKSIGETVAKRNKVLVELLNGVAKMPLFETDGINPDIVVNMFLTGFDATTLNTLWVDKNLKMHGLIQAYSRTNRILNSIKTFGNIVCFRNLQKRTDDAISLFGDKDAGGIVLMRGYKDYYFGYEDDDGKYHPGFVDMIEELETKFPLSEERITGEQNQKEFILLFGAILRMRNLLTSFDEFVGNEILSDRDLQDYLGRYQDLRDEWKNRKPTGEKEDITDDIIFEIELIKQIEINIDYILMLVKKYHDSHCDDKEVLITIQKAVDASPELRSKKALIESFIAGINDVDDVMTEWRTFVAEQKERELVKIIQEENLKEEETRKFIEISFRDGNVKTTGTDITNLMPPTSRFGSGNREEKKQNVISKLVDFFERFFGIG